MSKPFNSAEQERGVRRCLPLAILLLTISLAACGRDMHHRSLESQAATLEESRQAQIAINLAGLSSTAAPNGNLPGFHVNAAALQLRIEAPDVPAYTTHLPVTTFDNVVMVPVGTGRIFHLEVENHWGLAIYQGGPQIVDLAVGEKRELSFPPQPIETILPLVTASALSERETVLTVEEEDSPLQDLRLRIPGHALPQPLWVSIDEVYNVTRLPAPERQASVMIDIQPHGVRLTPPARLTLPYYQALVSRLQLPESHLRISFF